MKQILVMALALVLVACNNPGTSKNKPGDPPAARVVTPGRKDGDQPVIDSASAYSNLSVDSIRIQKFIEQQHVEQETAENMRRFYNYRHYQFAWFNDSGLTEQALAFRSLYDYDRDSSVKRTTLDNRLDELINNDSLKPAAADPQVMATELMMTWRLVNYMSGKLPVSANNAAKLNELVPFSKRSVNDWISFMEGTPLTIATPNKSQQRLQKALEELRAIEQRGGWDSLAIPRRMPTYKKPSPFFRLLKKRFLVTGQLKQPDTTAIATPDLVNAVRAAQAQFGYTHDSTVTIQLVKALNIPVAERIRQVIINLARMQWMPQIPSNDYILVNIPEYRLYLMNGQALIFGMDIITGKQGHSTVMFSGKLNQIVFSPYWNLPASVIKKEVIPKLKKNKKYLEKNKMEIRGHRKGLPVVRQLPGEQNELGKIKFLFPNSQDIYFHDTPHKWLFSKDLRAYSHGCIRLAEPEKLAQFLLAGNGAWTKEKIDSAMNSGIQKYVTLSKPVPVLIYYFTAWVDDAGVLQFRNDVYNHDEQFGLRIFRP